MLLSFHKFKEQKQKKRYTQHPIMENTRTIPSISTPPVIINNFLTIARTLTELLLSDHHSLLRRTFDREKSP